MKESDLLNLMFKSKVNISLKNVDTDELLEFTRNVVTLLKSKRENETELANKYVGKKDYKLNPNDILKAPANYLLEDCLKQLKFGRPAHDQKLLDKFIDITKLCYGDIEVVEKPLRNRELAKTATWLKGKGIVFNDGELSDVMIEMLTATYRKYATKINNS